MGVKESLVLDHFYISASPEEFILLTELKNLLGATTHSKVLTPDDSWEGIYVGCRTRVYFEILNARRRGGFGVCLSPYNPLYVDANFIRDELSHLPWRHGRRDTVEGKPWYDWIATCDYRDTEKTKFNAWIMRYHQTHRDWKTPIPKPSVDRWQSIRLRAGRDLVPEIREASSWFPGESSFSDAEVKFQIPDRDGSIFTIQIDLDSGENIFELREMSILLSDPEAGKRLREGNFGHYSFEVSDTLATFRRA